MMELAARVAIVAGVAIRASFVGGFIITVDGGLLMRITGSPEE